MNNTSPLVPQGSFLEQRNKGRARVKIAVFVVLAIHGIGLLALLMQGCKKEPEVTPAAGADQTNTTVAPAFAEPTNTPAAVSNPPVAQPNPSPVPEPVTQPSAAPPLANPTDYKVLKGDTYTTIAKKFHTTTKAITDANPGVDPAKLQIGQSLHIPAPTVSTPSSGGTSAPTAELAGAGQVYSVQSGDTLIGIAGKFKVTVKALRSANDLTTDKIKVGQKLKIPTRSAPAGTNSGATGTVPAAATAPVPQ
jgi:LysM repeat protein